MPSTRERHQHLDRTQVELTDQHGRTWLAESEIGFDIYGRHRIVPLGQFHPQFSAPYGFFPPLTYLVVDPRKPHQLTINYSAWLANLQSAQREVDEALERLAWAAYKDEAPKYIKDPSQEMLRQVYGTGHGPQPVEPVIAAMQGNKWVLGLREYDPKLPGDKRLKPYMEHWVKCELRGALSVPVVEGGPTDGYPSFIEGQPRPEPELGEETVDEDSFVSGKDL